jgi:hypothetical protein
VLEKTDTLDKKETQEKNLTFRIGRKSTKYIHARYWMYSFWQKSGQN